MDGQVGQSHSFNGCHVTRVWLWWARTGRTGAREEGRRKDDKDYALDIGNMTHYVTVLSVTSGHQAAGRPWAGPVWAFI